MSDEMLKLAERYQNALPGLVEYGQPATIMIAVTIAERDLIVSALRAAAASLCEDCPPVGYPTDKTRCTPCPRAAAASAEPVAWRASSDKKFANGLLTDDPTVVEAWREHPSITVQPLYTSPAPDAEIVGADLEYDAALAAYNGCDSVRRWHSPAAAAELISIRDKARERLNAAKSRRAAALAKAKGGSQPAWQPIETAPREQTILVAGGDASYPVTACWSGLNDECWMVDGQEDVHAEIGWPTHWMPLPGFSK